MIKLTGSVYRKVPIPGTEFSSQSFGACMEVEIGSESSFQEVKNKLKEIYQALEESVQGQIVSNGGSLPGEETGNGSPENGSRPEGDPITPNQKKLIEKLVRERKIFGHERIRLLDIRTKEEAKSAIKALLSNGQEKK